MQGYALRLLIVAFRAATLQQKVVVGIGDIWRARGARDYTGGLGEEPPAGPRVEPMVGD